MADADEIYYWQVWCTTESKYEYIWLDTEPTVCPSNSEHTIQTSPGPTVLNKISKHVTKIQEEDVGGTNGIFQFRGYKIEIPQGLPGNVTSYDCVWPRTVTIMDGWFHGTEENVGDFMNANVTATIGAITAGVSANTGTFSVTSTVIDNIFEGYNLHLTDFAKIDHLGEVMEVHAGNSTVTSEYLTLNSYSPLSPTYVQATSRVIRDLHISTVGRYAFAEKKIGGRSLPANIPIVIDYHNCDGNAKTFTFYIEILY
jgi:hypothetical protein